MAITDCHPKKTCISYAHYTVIWYYLKFLLPLKIQLHVSDKSKLQAAYLKFTFCTKLSYFVKLICWPKGHKMFISTKNSCFEFFFFFNMMKEWQFCFKNTSHMIYNLKVNQIFAHSSIIAIIQKICSSPHQ